MQPPHRACTVAPRAAPRPGHRPAGVTLLVLQAPFTGCTQGLMVGWRRQQWARQGGGHHGQQAGCACQAPRRAIQTTHSKPWRCWLLRASVSLVTGSMSDSSGKVTPKDESVMAGATAGNPIALKEAPEENKRIVHARSSQKNEEYCDNRVITSKFTWWNFVPLFLYAKFR